MNTFHHIHHRMNINKPRDSTRQTIISQRRQLSDVTSISTARTQPTANVRCTWREPSAPSLYTFLPFPDVRQGIISTVKFGQRVINSTSGFLKDSVPKVGFRLMAFLLGQLACENTKTTITWLPMWLPIDCVPEDLYLCVQYLISARALSLTLRLNKHLMLKPYYILHLPYSYPTSSHVQFWFSSV